MKNPFKVDNSYLEKNKILKVLYDHWEDGERKTNFGTEITELGRSLSVLDIQDLTQLQRKEIERLLISLSNAGHISLFQKDIDKNQKNHKWIITESGRQAIADNFYLNQLGIDNRQLFFQLGGFVFGLLGIIIGGYSLFQSNSLEKRIEKLEQKEETSISIDTTKYNNQITDTLKTTK